MECASSRRYLSLWLRRLATDRVTRQSRRPADRPLALVGPVKNARLLLAVNDAAARQGLSVAMSFTDACAIHPALDWAEMIPHEDARLLASIAEWCERYTPLVGSDPPDGLILDITGVAHLFGGERALARDLVKRLAGQGFHARIGIADSVGAAWAAARHGSNPILPQGRSAEHLAPLLVAALRLAPETKEGLVQLGLRTIGDIMDRPRAPLAARFGPSLMQRLDQALGREEEPITPRLPLPPFSVEQGFPEPLSRDEDLLAVLAQLAERLCWLLEQHGKGARQVLASFFAVDGTVRRLQIGTSRPLRDAGQLHRLLTEKFALTQWDNAFGFDRIRLAVLESESAAPAQTDWSEGEHGLGIAHLIDRLSARLGTARVLRLIPQDTHVPEQACVAIPAANAAEFTIPFTSPSWGGRRGEARPVRRSPKGEDGRAEPGGWGESPQTPAQDSLVPARPLRLFERPEPVETIAAVPDGPPVRFRWRLMSHKIARLEGPERIAMPWWRDEKNRALMRDYFRVETADGVRLWLYREGVYDGTTQPRWFLHGFLA